LVHEPTLKGGAHIGGDSVNNTLHGAKASPIVLPLVGDPALERGRGRTEVGVKDKMRPSNYFSPSPISPPARGGEDFFFGFAQLTIIIGGLELSFYKQS